MTVDFAQITGIARSVSQLLSNNRYGLDFYQREYSWEETQVGELIDDLATRFLDEFDERHERRRVASYRPYFLGPIVTAQRDGLRYLVDGQQRVTTLSLLLIYLRQALISISADEAAGLNSLIYSTSFGRKSFNLDVDEREQCLTAILDGNNYDVTNEPESVRNLWERYHYIVFRFPSDLLGPPLQYFVKKLCSIPYDCLVRDPHEVWFLCFDKSKMPIIYTIALSPIALGTILDQQLALKQDQHGVTNLLFLDTKGQAVSPKTFMAQLNRLAINKDIRDATSKVWRFQARQFR